MSGRLPRGDFAVSYVRARDPHFSLRGARHRDYARLAYDEARRLFTEENGASVPEWRARWLRGELPDTGDNHAAAADSLMLRLRGEP